MIDDIINGKNTIKIPIFAKNVLEIYFRITKACYSTLTEEECSWEVNKICQNLKNMSILRRKQ